MTIRVDRRFAPTDPQPTVIEDQTTPDWRDALCRQVDHGDVFFPPKGGDPGPAKRICALCPLRSLCLCYALDNDIREGVWGGLSPNQRARLRRAPRVA